VRARTRDQFAIATVVAQRRMLAGPSDLPHDVDRPAGFARPGPVYLHGDGLCPRRTRWFWDDWAATTYHQRHTFARIALEMRWARRLLTGSVDELVCREAQFMFPKRCCRSCRGCIPSTRFNGRSRAWGCAVQRRCHRLTISSSDEVW
jgi:hypothetical protein